MQNQILKEITSSFPNGEEMISYTKLYRQEGSCNCLLVLSNLRLFLFDNTADNDCINFYTLENITEIKKVDNVFTIKMNEIDDMHFSYISENDTIKDFFEKLSFLTQPILEEKKQIQETAVKKKKEKRKRGYLTAFLVLLAIFVLSAGGTLGYRYYLVQQEEASKQEQLEKKQAIIEKTKKQIDLAEQQITFNERYRKRLETYSTFLTSLNEHLEILDISDKTMDWEVFKNEINAQNIVFTDIKIEDEDMLDPGAYVNEDEGYIATKTRIINQNIQGVLDNIISNIDTKFSNDASLLITIRETCDDTKTLIDNLTNSLEIEEDLLNDSITELKASLK